MKISRQFAVALVACTVAGTAAADITLYEDAGFSGRAFASQWPIDRFDRIGLNDRVSSLDVRGERWEVCEDAGFGGRCTVLRPGRYPSLESMGLNDRLSSARPLRRDARYEDDRYAPEPIYDARRRPAERLYQANVTSVHAVVGPPQQRCWVEREQVSPDRRGANLPAGIAGAVIGGILGHQIGGGTGRDLSTVGGAVGGGVLGANIGRGPEVRDVQRCANVPGDGRPDYWDVSYFFRGVEHRVQLQSPPGPTLTVNAQGEPRA